MSADCTCYVRIWELEQKITVLEASLEMRDEQIKHLAKLVGLLDGESLLYEMD